MQLIQEVGLNRVIKYAIFSFWQLVFDLLPFSPLRVFWLKLWGAKIGPGNFIDRVDFFNLDRTGLSGLKIGSHCFIGRSCLIDLAGQVTLGDWVTLSPRVIILSHINVGLKGHWLLKYYPAQAGQTQIQSHSFLGVNTIVLSGVKISSQSLVAAGSVVTRHLPGHSLIAGSPAQVKKRLK